MWERSGKINSDKQFSLATNVLYHCEGLIQSQHEVSTKVAAGEELVTATRERWTCSSSWEAADLTLLNTLKDRAKGGRCFFFLASNRDMKRGQRSRNARVVPTDGGAKVLVNGHLNRFMCFLLVILRLCKVISTPVYWDPTTMHLNIFIKKKQNRNLQNYNYKLENSVFLLVYVGCLCKST